MSLHSGSYVRDLVGHVPDQMLCLRQDEVSGISRMNIQHNRRVSLPSKLSGITEREHSEAGDIQDSLNKSYSQMKTKLDELEEYNQKLEKQLSDIFSSISASVSKAARPDKPVTTVGNESEEKECSWHTEPGTHALPRYPGSFSQHSQGSLLGIESVIKPRQQIRNNKHTILEEDLELTSKVSPTSSSLFKNLMSKLENIPMEDTNNKRAPMEKKMSRKDSSAELWRRSGTIPRYEELKQGDDLINESNGVDTELYEVKKHTILHLVEDEVKPISITKKKDMKEEDEHEHTAKDESCAQDLEYPRSQTGGIPNIRTKDMYPHVRSEKETRRVSCVEPHTFSTLADIKEEERARRLSTGTMHRISNLPIGERRRGKRNKKRSSPVITVSTIATTSCEDVGVSDLLLSPPEYFTFHEESDSADEFFLFSQDVLNVDFETICEELARFSPDMEILLDVSDSNSSYLKAARASDEWKTLWIYRGI
jgi:hypothetical protein